MSGEVIAAEVEQGDDLAARLEAALAVSQRAREAERQQRPRLYVVK